MARFSEPEGVLPIYATATTHGHSPRAAPLPRAASRGDEPLDAFAFVRPLAGTHGLTSRAVFLPEKENRGTGPTRAKVRAVFRRGESPSRTDSAHLFRRARTRAGGGNLSRVVRAPGETPHANARRATARPKVPAPPREGWRVPAKTGGAFHRRAPVRAHEDRSPRFARWASRPRGTCAPEGTDALQLGRACASSTDPRCPA